MIVAEPGGEAGDGSEKRLGVRGGMGLVYLRRGRLGLVSWCER